MIQMIFPGVGRHLRRSGSILLLTGLLAACNTAQEARGRVAFVATAYASGEGSPQRVPLVSLPDAGSAVLVDESRRRGALHQKIVFGRDGSSRADLSLGTAGSGISGMAKPTRLGIAAELAQLPDGPYRVSREPARNAYGPVGVALNGRCAFAWQWIEDLHGIGLGDTSEMPGRISASLRVHHCSRGSSESLIRDLSRLRLGAALPERIARAPRRARPARAPEKVQVSSTPDPVATMTPPAVARPLVTVNGSRTLVSIPPDRGTADYAVDSGRPVVPRPGAAGSEALDQPRYLTDPAPARPSSSAPVDGPSGASLSRADPPAVRLVRPPTTLSRKTRAAEGDSGPKRQYPIRATSTGNPCRVVRVR